MCVIDAGRSYKVVSPIPLARRWLGKLIRHWAIDRLWIRGIGPGCVAGRSLPERVLDLNRGQTLCFEELDLLRERRALRLDTEYQTLQKRESKTETYRGVGKERNRVSDQVVSIHEGMSWHVPANSFTPPSPATHPTFLPFCLLTMLRPQLIAQSSRNAARRLYSSRGPFFSRNGIRMDDSHITAPQSLLTCTRFAPRAAVHLPTLTRPNLSWGTRLFLFIYAWGGKLKESIKSKLEVTPMQSSTPGLSPI